MSSNDALARLAAVIESRKPANGGDPEKSYVARLLHKGPDAFLKKIGEEATETVMAAKDMDHGGDAHNAEQHDRASQQVGIVHLGIGAFHRAHQAYYTDALMNTGEALDWAICGVGLRAEDRSKDVNTLAAKRFIDVNLPPSSSFYGEIREDNNLFSVKLPLLKIR